MTGRALALALVVLTGCSLSTSRPPFQAMPEARVGDLDVEVPVATERLAKALTDAGIPVARVAPEDGYLETPWFDTATGRPASGRPLGLDVVRVRGWVTPSAHGSSEIKVETVYRPIADPSRPSRELERSVPYAHPVRVLVRNAYRAIGARITTEEPDAITLSARREATKRAPLGRDTIAPDSIPADSAPEVPAIAAADSVRPPADSARPAADAARQAPADTTRAVVDTAVPPVRPVPRDTAAPQPPVARPAPVQAPARPPQDTARAAPPPAATSGFTVQVAATADSSDASLAARRLGAMGIEANVVRDGGLLKVRSGAYPTRQAAQTVLSRVRRSFPDAFIVR